MRWPENNSLVQKARALVIPRRRLGITPEEVMLAVSWAKDEIGVSAVRTVMGLKTDQQTYLFLAMALREYIRKAGGGDG